MLKMWKVRYPDDTGTSGGNSVAGDAADKGAGDTKVVILDPNKYDSALKKAQELQARLDQIDKERRDKEAADKLSAAKSKEDFEKLAEDLKKRELELKQSAEQRELQLKDKELRLEIDHELRIAGIAKPEYARMFEVKIEDLTSNGAIDKVKLDQAIKVFVTANPGLFRATQSGAAAAFGQDAFSGSAQGQKPMSAEMRRRQAFLNYITPKN